MGKTKETLIEWDYFIPLYGNRFIFLDMCKALGIPVGFIVVLIGMSCWNLYKNGSTISFYGFQYALILVGILAFFTMLLLWILYQNRFDTHFIVDNYAARMALNPGHRKRARGVSILLIILGAFAKKPGMVGTGLIAQSSESAEIPWTDVFYVKYWDKLHAISLRNSWRQIGVLYCPKEQYEEICRLVREQVVPHESKRSNEMKAIKKDRWWRVFMILPAMVSVFFLTAIYEYAWDNKVILYIIGCWLLLTILVPGWLRRLFAIIGWFGLGITWLGMIIPELADGPYSYDKIRIAFFSLGIVLSAVTLYLCFRNYKTVR
ncbi:MAG: hypothetical protein PHD83_05715 [Caldisericia bacterium]|nr:hypothetical protein [Caldisericia bacterium]